MPQAPSPQLGNPFDSIESAQEFVRLLSQAADEAQAEVQGLIAVALESNQPRRVEALRLVSHKLDGLRSQMLRSQRSLKDLRTLRRLLEGAASAATASD